MKRLEENGMQFYSKRPKYKFFSFLHHPGVSMVESREARDAWISTSCRRQPQQGCQREDRELLSRSQIHHQGKHQCMTEITTVRPETSWAFPDSYTADNSGNECSSNGGLSWEVQHKSLCFCPFFEKHKGLHLFRLHRSYIPCTTTAVHWFILYK